MQLKSSLKQQSGQYDFSGDGGAVGIINLLVHLPRFAQIYNFAATAVVAPLSAGAATISFGFIETEGGAPVVNPTAYMVANAFGAFALAVPLAGVNLFANPIKQLLTTNVVMAIGGAALTAGRLQFSIWYTENVF